jgi:enolase
MHRIHRAPALLLFLLTVVAIPVAGCGKSDTASTTTTTSANTSQNVTTTSPTAAAASSVCTARSDVKSAIDKAATDAKSGNFGDMATSMQDAQSAMKTLVSSLKDLTAAQRDKVQSQLDTVSNEFKDLTTSVSSKADLNASIDKIKTDVDTVIDSIGNDLSC